MLSKSPDDFTLGLQALKFWIDFWALFALASCSAAPDHRNINWGLN
jgi:hypothetical protein